MVTKITFSKRALHELDKIYDYYEKSEVGLGNKFYTKFDKKIIQISEFPKSGVAKKKTFRETYLSVFPLAIIYKYNEIKNEIFITSVFHFKRSPLKKYKL
jgi:plasmid stabilization system protein ParE